MIPWDVHNGLDKNGGYETVFCESDVIECMMCEPETSPALV